MYLLPLLNFNRYVFNPSTTLPTTFPQFPFSNSRLSNTYLDFIPPSREFEFPPPRNCFLPGILEYVKHQSRISTRGKRRGKRRREGEKKKKRNPFLRVRNSRLHTPFVRVAPAHGQTNCSRVSVGGEGEEGGSDKTRRIENHGFDRP